MRSRGAVSAGSDDATRALWRIIPRAARALGTAHVVAARGEGGVFRVVAGSGVGVRLIGVEVPPGLGLIGASPSRRAVTTADYARRSDAAPPVLRAKVRGLAVAPILVGDVLAGCVCALRLRPRAFGARQLQALEEFAAEAAEAMQTPVLHRRDLVTVLEHMPSGVVVLDAAGRAAVLNEAGRRIIGVPVDPSRPLVDQEPGYRLLDPDTGAELDRGALVTRALTDEGIHGLHLLLRPPGAADEAHVRLSTMPLHEQPGRPSGAVAVFTDVTAEHRLVHDLRASEERLRVAYDAMACGVIVSDAGGAILQANRAAEQTLDMSAERLREGVDLSFFRRTTEEGTELPSEAYPARVALRDHRPVRDCVVEVRKPDGARRWLHLDVVPVLDDRGAVTHLVSSFIDITDRKRAEEEIAECSRQQEAVVELSRQALVVTAFSDLMYQAVALVATSLRAEFVKVLELLPDGGELALRAGTGWRPGIVGSMVLRVDESQGGYAIRAGAPVVVDDLATDTRFRKPAFLADHGVMSGASVVIDSKDRPFGALSVYTRQRRSFSVSDVRLLQLVANVLGAVAQRERRRAQRSVLLARLTPREREILRLVAKGLSNRDIAERLGIGYATVRQHVRGCIEKLDARSRLEAVARARASGLLPDDNGPW